MHVACQHCPKATSNNINYLAHLKKVNLAIITHLLSKNVKQPKNINDLAMKIVSNYAFFALST